MTRSFLQLALWLPGIALASPWSFGDPIGVAGESGTPQFHHLDGAGRRHIAAAELRIEKRAVAPVRPPVAVNPVTDHGFQGYPAAARGPDGRLLVAWEDRRAGNTRLFYACRGLR